jgi:CRP/FNR family transcriptional regulator, cyclic AMP receptor protein
VVQEILLEVLEQDGCPLFKNGDRMVLNLPNVDTKGGAKVCALAMAKFFQENVAVGCVDEVLDSLPKRFVCPRTYKPVTFSVDVIEPLEVRKSCRPESTVSLQEVESMLREVPILQTLSRDLIHELAQRVREQRYTRGDLVIEKGQPGEHFYIVRSGILHVVDVQSGYRSVIGHLSGRDCFGEMSLLTGSPCSATVIAQSDVELLCLPASDFDLLLERAPELARRFIHLLATRLNAANSLVALEGSKTFSGKLDMLGLSAIIQIISGCRRSGTLRIETEDDRMASILFSEGEIFAAICGALNSVDAIFEALMWPTGDFWFDTSVIPEKNEVQMSVMEVLLEGMRHFDETGVRDHSATDPDYSSIPSLADPITLDCM